MTSQPDPDDQMQALLAVAQRLGRLRPDWQRPERFFEERSELAAELRRLAHASPKPPRRRPAHPSLLPNLPEAK